MCTLKTFNTDADASALAHYICRHRDYRGTPGLENVLCVGSRDAYLVCMVSAQENSDKPSTYVVVTLDAEYSELAASIEWRFEKNNRPTLSYVRHKSVEAGTRYLHREVWFYKETKNITTVDGNPLNLRPENVVSKSNSEIVLREREMATLARDVLSDEPSVDLLVAAE